MSFDKVHDCKVIDVIKLAEDVFSIKVDISDFDVSVKPGQFVNVKCGIGLETYLRRPISVCDADIQQKTMTLAFQIRGKGTKILAETKLGDIVNVMGPLGTEFYQPESGNIAVVGGGIGIFPLYYLLKELPYCKRTTYLGFRNKDAIFMEADFTSVSDKINIATDDGSYGYNGFVTAMLKSDLEAGNIPDVIYTCGPAQMMGIVARFAKEYGVKCQVSMEERMGCGIGACLVCSCKLKSDNESGWYNGHVCKDGPVIWSDRIFEG